MKQVLTNFRTHLTELIVVVATILSPILPVLYAITFLVVVDLIFGITASYKNKESITSNKMSNTISKFILYNLAIISAFSMTFIIGNTIPIVHIVAGTIACVEFKSIGENFFKATNIDLIDGLKEIFKRKFKDK
jgi:phosphate/sulfate permease